MKREEAIENLKGCVCGYEVGKDGKPNGNVTADLTQETIDMAIKALENEPFMNKPCVANRVCHEDKVKVLDKIRAEIVHLHDWAFSREEILRIIDKYNAESEE